MLEATVDRDLLLRATRLLRVGARVLPLPRMPDLTAAYTPHSDLTHRVDVRAFTGPKRTAMAAHTQQASADRGTRTLQVLLRLPVPVFGRVVGHEWYRQPGRVPPRPLLDDVFAGLYG